MTNYINNVNTQNPITDGQLSIGKTSTGIPVLGTLTAGTNVTITNGSGAITIASSAPTLGQTYPIIVGQYTS